MQAAQRRVCRDPRAQQRQARGRIVRVLRVRGVRPFPAHVELGIVRDFEVRERRVRLERLAKRHKARCRFEKPAGRLHRERREARARAEPLEDGGRALDANPCISQVERLELAALIRSEKRLAELRAVCRIEVGADQRQLDHRTLTSELAEGFDRRAVALGMTELVERVIVIVHRHAGNRPNRTAAKGPAVNRAQIEREGRVHFEQRTGNLGKGRIVELAAGEVELAQRRTRNLCLCQRDRRLHAAARVAQVERRERGQRWQRVEKRHDAVVGEERELL